MKRAAIGIRAHSGWAAVVAVGADFSSPRILARQRIVVIDSSGPRANQPYHFVKDLPLDEAQAHLNNCARAALLMATKGLEAMENSLRKLGYEIVGGGVLTASGRVLPGLPDILASHAMIHAAEGEFFRNVFADACEELGIAVVRIRERELLDRAAKELRVSSAKIEQQLRGLRRDLGPPWTQDQKSAVMAAWLLLNGDGSPRR